MKQPDDACGAPHYVPETGWTCGLPRGHDGRHKCTPPTVTPTEILQGLNRSEPVSLEGIVEAFGHLPCSEETP